MDSPLPGGGRLGLENLGASPRGSGVPWAEPADSVWLPQTFPPRPPHLPRTDPRRVTQTPLTLNCFLLLSLYKACSEKVAFSVPCTRQDVRLQGVGLTFQVFVKFGQGPLELAGNAQVSAIAGGHDSFFCSRGDQRKSKSIRFSFCSLNVFLSRNI